MTTKGTLSFVDSHSIDSSPAFAPVPASVMVNSSTGCGIDSTFRSIRAWSCAWSYWVPHWPVCLLMINFHAVYPGRVYSV